VAAVILSGVQADGPIGINAIQHVYLPPPLEPHAFLHQLPAPVPGFVGRAEEIEFLVSALRVTAASGAAVAVSGIRGLGGVGKTQLAYATAARLASDFPDAQLLLELRGSRSDPTPVAQALQTVIRAFGTAAPLPDEPAQLQRLYRSLLKGKRALLLLDDAGNVAQVEALLPPPGSALLVTSRTRFTLPGMETLDLGPLPAPEAEALVVSMCKRVGAAAALLGKLCGYLPLALRLAAGVLASDDTRPVQDFLARLERERLRHLRDPDAPADDPTASMEASLQLSYDALEPLSRTALCQLSIFPTAFAQQVAVAAVAVRGKAQGDIGSELVSELRRRSLLDWNEATAQYSLHELVRVFAAHRLNQTAPDVQQMVRLRAAQWYVGVAQQRAGALEPGAMDASRPQSVQEGKFSPPVRAAERLEALAWLERERENLVASVEWAFQSQAWEVVWRLAGALFTFFEIRSLWIDGERTQHLAVEASRRANNRSAEGVAFTSLGIIYDLLGQWDKAIGCYEQSLAVFRQVGDRLREGVALGNLGITYKQQGQWDKATDCYEQSLAVFRQVGDRRLEGPTLTNLGNIYRDQGRWEEAIGCYEQSLAIFREYGDRLREGAALTNLGVLYERQEYWNKAIGCYEQSLVIFRQVGDRLSEGQILGNLGNVYRQQGYVAEAIALWQTALELLSPGSPEHTRVATLLEGAAADRGSAHHAPQGHWLRRLLRAVFGSRRNS
jgi:tetratricopeptide (TPR) repeat protein